jgi:hypothetical protein
MTPRVLPVAAVLLLLLPPFLPFGPGEGPPALPDLSVRPGDIHFSVFGEDVEIVSQEYRFLTIGVFVHNAGPGTSTTANVTFFDNGRPLALVPITGNLTASGPGNETYVEFTWYIRDTPTGNHTIRLEVADPAGDANPADNAAEQTIVIHGRVPVISVKFNTASKRASVTATSAGIVAFTGSIEVDHTSGPADITLDANVDVGWSCKLNWTSLVMTDYSPHDFCLTVTIPPAARNSQFGNIRVSARATVDELSSTAETRAIISVDPYFCLTAAPAAAKVAVAPSENALFKLELRNTGNAVDSFSIDVVNAAALADQGWQARLSAAQLNRVSPDSKKTISIEMVPTEDWTPYIDKSACVEVVITSLNSRDFGPGVNTTVLLSVVQKGFFMPSVGLIGLVALLAVIVGAVAIRAHRRRKKRKTVADYNRELHLDD